MHVKLVFTFLSTFALNLVFSQTDLSQFNIKAQKINNPPNIDGNLDDACWQAIEASSDFTQFEPNYNTKPTFDTQFKVAYDDEAFYFCAFLKDEQPDSILKELGYYDNLDVNADYVGLFLDTYNDKQNGYGFFLTASGIQSDARYSQTEGQNFQWNAIWYSKTKITDEGWYVEMKIPYSSIRFPEKAAQNWGINVWRHLRRKREGSSWVPYNPNADGFVNQWGILSNLTDINVPVRLSLTPYFSYAIDAYNSKVSGETISLSNAFKGGADVKYGINESFTLDMTLIPDFGQTRSDDQVLNLSPFEVQFDENRGFFLEGTELFNTGGLFYSRRIGGTPLNYDEVDENSDYEIDSNPSETQLINATKISGRTGKQTGLGLFNAVSAKTYAVVKDENGEHLNIETNPLTNYNIFVVDQSLKNNSSVSFINTNVIRNGHYRDANVSSALFDIKNKERLYGITGAVAMSNVFNPEHESEDTVKTGFKYRIKAGKVSGKFQYNVGYYVETDEYDPNDLGFLYNNNEQNLSMFASYRINDPVWRFLRMWNFIGINYNRLFKPNTYTGSEIWGDHGVMWKKWVATGIYYELNPFGGYDYFEPRTDGRFFKIYPNYYVNGFVSTDYRKTFAIDVKLGYGTEPKPGNQLWQMDISPRWRINDKIKLIHNFSFVKNLNTGYLDDSDDDIIFSKREIDTYENLLTGSYIFTSKMALDLRFRHYWRKLVPKEFLLLEKDGTTSSNDDFKGNYVDAQNYFNLDLVYKWQFSPGSELSVVWKNAIAQDDDIANSNYFDNFDKLRESASNNNISLKVVYYLDYLYLKRFSKKS